MRPLSLEDLKKNQDFKIQDSWSFCEGDIVIVHRSKVELHLQCSERLTLTLTLTLTFALIGEALLQESESCSERWL